MPAHTPGPWRVKVGKSAGRHLLVYPESDIRKYGSGYVANPIARVFSNWPDETAERDANARLIAAAPRMYERLKRDVEQCGCNSLPVRPVKMPDGSVQVGCGYCKEKRAILRDVEGESHG